MFRRSNFRLGHQLIKEPMGHEENTFARGMRTKHNALSHMSGLAAFCGVGCVLAVFSFISGQRRVYKAVGPDGKLTRTTCPVRWWNY